MEHTSTVLDLSALIPALVNSGAAGLIGYLAITRIDAFGVRLDAFHASLLAIIAEPHGGGK